MAGSNLYFVTGTGTEVGKTYVTSLIARTLSLRGKRVGVYKPVASGCEMRGGEWVSSDAEQLWNAAGQPRSLHDVCPQRFVAALSPPEAANREGKQVDEDLLVEGASPWLRPEFDIVLIEGAGGLFSPISDSMLNVDLYQRFSDANLVVVAENQLGAVHQTLATCRAARQAGVEPFGIVLNQSNRHADDSIASNAKAIQRYGSTPVVAQVSFGAESLTWDPLSQ